MAVPAEIALALADHDELHRKLECGRVHRAGLDTARGTDGGRGPVEMIGSRAALRAGTASDSKRHARAGVVGGEPGGVAQKVEVGPPSAS